MASPRRDAPFFGFAAGCAAFYLGAQTLQYALTRLVLPANPSELERLLGRHDGAEALRALAVLASMFGLVPIYAAVALRRGRVAPGAAISGALFGLLFVAFELSYRSLDFFLVGGPWAAAARAGDASVLARVALWEQAITAWYVPLLSAHLASTVAFTIACWPRPDGDRWDWLGAASFGLNGLRLVARLLGGYAGVKPLAALSGPLYFPAVAVVNALLLAWLVRQARLAAREAAT